MEPRRSKALRPETEPRSAHAVEDRGAASAAYRANPGRPSRGVADEQDELDNIVLRTWN